MTRKDAMNRSPLQPMVLGLFRLACFAALACFLIPPNASAQSLTVIHPDDPMFDSLLAATYPGTADLGGAQRRFMVLLRNDTTVAINAYLVAWELQTSDGTTHRMQVSFVRRNYLGKQDDTPLLPGQVCMVSPFLYAPPAASGRPANFTHITTVAYGQPFDLDQVRSVTASLDEAIFEDGARIGPRRFQLSAKYDCVLAAEIDEPASIRRLIESNAPEGDIVLRLNKDIAPLSNPNLYRSSQREDICAQYRGDVAQRLMGQYRYGGIGGLSAQLTPAPNITVPSNFQTLMLLPVQFSADVVRTITIGANQPRQVAVQHLRVGPGKLRINVDGSDAMSTILDLGQKRSWQLLINRQWATDTTPQVQWDSLGLPALQMRPGPAIARPFDPSQPCLLLANISCEKTGADTVDGRPCDLWVLTQSEQRRPAVTTRMTLCIDAKLRFPLRTQDTYDVYELHNVQESPQDAGLFAIPDEYHKLFADGTESGPPAIAFDLTAFQQNSHASHEGDPLDRVGLSEGDVASVTALIGVAPDQALARRIDMGEGLENGLVIQGNGNELCGATGNCDTWFLRKSAGEWQFSVSTNGSRPESGMYVAMFGFVPPKHNGLLEMITIGRGGGFQYPFEVWWFDGAKYAPHADYCWYPGPGKGQVVEGGCR
jgi:hypothetical protein